MPHRKATKKEVERFDKMRSLGCVVCLQEGVYTPPAIHHMDGQTKKDCHKKTIPLCDKHHQYPAKSSEYNFGVKPWISRHGDGRKPFEERYGTEEELLEKTNELIGWKW